MSACPHISFKRSSRESGNFLLDDELLSSEGLTDLDKYRSIPGEFFPDFFM